MVSERRSLTFSNEELRHALQRFDRSKLNGLPHGEIRAAAVTAADEGSDITIAISTVDDNGDVASQEVDLGRPQLAAILIHYCMRMGIPIPRAAGKHVSSAGNQLVLNLALDSGRDDAQRI